MASRLADLNQATFPAKGAPAKKIKKIIVHSAILPYSMETHCNKSDSRHLQETTNC